MCLRGGSVGGEGRGSELTLCWSLEADVELLPILSLHERLIPKFSLTHYIH